MNSLPAPISLFSKILPPIAVINSFEMESPKPVPFGYDVAVGTIKNLWKIFSLYSFGMPEPKRIGCYLSWCREHAQKASSICLSISIATSTSCQTILMSFA